MPLIKPCQFAQDTSLHGVKNAFHTDTEARKYRKMLWKLVLICSTCGCVTLVIMLVVRVFQYESITSVKQTIPNTLEFPTVTVCNMNSLKKSILDNKLIMNYLRLRKDQNSSLYLNETLQQWYKNEFEQVSVTKFAEAYTFNLSETVVYCSITGKSCNSYFTFLITENGHCYSFNSRELIDKHGPILITQPGSAFGLSLVLDTNTDLSLQLNQIGTGYLVLIHEPNIFPLMYQQSFILPPGKMTHVSVTMSVHQHLSTPYSEIDCIDASEDQYMGYSQEKCLHKCILLQLNNGTCDTYSTEGSTCTLYDFLESLFHNVNLISIASNCSKCKPNCKEVDYLYQLSSAYIADGQFLQAAQFFEIQQRNLSYLKENYVFANIYFEKLRYSSFIQTKKYTFDTILSNIGGLLGITLGASVITILELLEYFVHLFLNFWKINFVSSNKITATPQHS